MIFAFDHVLKELLLFYTVKPDLSLNAINPDGSITKRE